ncbi:MAG: DUF92 domain-containing protein [Methanophagales archaeon]|nr:DUF92 domain-containing protein [Methanophagales archaeon]
MLFSELMHQHLFPVTVAVLILLIAFSLVLYAYVKRKINTSALIGTLILGAIILLALGPRFGCAGVLVLLTFFLSGNLVTKYKYDRKAELGVAEGNKGMRNINNVLGNGLSPVIFALLYYAISCQSQSQSGNTILLLGFSGAVATACADTFSTEIGQAEGNPKLITTLKKVPVGTNGGVSLPGLGASMLGSGLISLAALAFWFGVQKSPRTVLLLTGVCLLSGFLGGIVDSLLGATVEDRKPLKLNKHHVNILATLFGGVFAILLGCYFGLFLT